MKLTKKQMLIIMENTPRHLNNKLILKADKTLGSYHPANSNVGYYATYINVNDKKLLVATQYGRIVSREPKKEYKTPHLKKR